MDIYLTKINDETLTTSTPEDTEKLKKIKRGEVVRVTLTRPRNYQFHKKWFRLVKFAFEQWEPVDSHSYRTIIPEKNFERFRKDIIILAGYYDSFYRVDGSVRMEAKSISFASMTEEEFEKLYSATIDVILNKILIHGYDRPELERVLVEELIQYT